ncbi:glutathione S-transferase family protein [Pseudomonas sp. NPDC090202]|uniref:glutathione S-transferase family protein n=1 Tax=unclassified Pseudomonas TaxID=196821 RepID=UPI0037FDD74B
MSDPIELYGAQTGNSLRAAVALSEAGIPYRAVCIDLRAGAHRQPPFLDLNPAGKVPTLVDRSVSPTLIINQSNAIMQYADAKAPGRLAPQASGPERFRVFDRYFHFVTDVIAVSHAGFFLRQQGLRDMARPLDQRAVELLIAAERFLEDDYMAGSQFSMADISAFTYAASVHERLPWDTLPRLAQWFERIAERPAVQAGMLAFSQEDEQA